VHDDLVVRQFSAQRPNELWLTDITEHPTAQGKLYLCAIKDACTNRIVGYAMDSRMTSQLAVDTLANAIALAGQSARSSSDDVYPRYDVSAPSQPEGAAAALCSRRRSSRRRGFSAALQRPIPEWAREAGTPVAYGRQGRP
jgi:transposase InsO family protein